MRTVVRDRAIGRPETPDDLHALLEDPLVVLERHLAGQVLAPIVAAAGGELDSAAAQQIERGPLLRDADRMMQRQHGDRGREADMPGPRRDVGQHEIGTGENAERAEVMLTDPRGVHAKLLRVERFDGDVGDELVRRARIVQVVVVTEREVPEFHEDSLLSTTDSPRGPRPEPMPLDVSALARQAWHSSPPSA